MPQSAAGVTHPSFMIDAARMFDGTSMHGAARVVIAQGHIVEVTDAGLPRPEGGVLKLPENAILAPGLIDIQVNGGGGALLNADPSLAAIRQVMAAHRRFGTTGMLPTLITDAPERLRHLPDIAAEAMKIPGILGFHLEGPHINPLRKGIHPQEFMRSPGDADLALLKRFGAHGRSLVTVAPECVNASDTASLVASGLVVSAGHSAARAAQIPQAIAAGLTGVTHLFNAMSQITSREPGLVGATLDDTRLSAGIIADGVSVDPINLRLAFRMLGPGRLMLVTDAMPSLGDPGPGDFMLCGNQIRLVDGRLVDDQGTIAGAHIGMIEAVRNAVHLMGATLSEALVMASRTPARFLGLDASLGQIAAGYRADLVAFDPDFRVIDTWIGGKAATGLPASFPALSH